MFRKGKFVLKIIYWHGQKEFIAYDKRFRDRHTHIPYNKATSAKMIVVRAYEGKIPEDYPKWMVKSINRLWYGTKTTRLDYEKNVR